MLNKFASENLTLDFSKSQFALFLDHFPKELWQKALNDMQKIESGEIMNQTEQRMVGHYWLRSFALCPDVVLRQQMENDLLSLEKFVEDLDSGRIRSSAGKAYQQILLIGIGGSALGPQFIAKALKFKAKRKIFFFDNTDPEGLADVLSEMGDLDQTLVITVTKSGSTPETVNGWKVAEYAFQQQGIAFAPNAVAITMPGSKLDQYALSQSWLARFPMYDWIGGRTSLWSSVGLLPFALLGFEVRQLLKGARDLDLLCRNQNILDNPALQLATYWYQEAEGKAKKDLVVIPYADRLDLFSKYLQQLIMESLGKEHDLSGRIVNQGLTVFGNKGSTDQHSYIQQLRSGVNNFFAIFIRTTAVDSKYNLKIGDNYISDYLNGLMLGTRQALFENGRHSLTITMPQVNEYFLGMLIALFERAVSYYASFVNINAYDQPGVEAGKKAADQYLQLLRQSGEMEGVPAADRDLLVRLKIH